MKKNFTIIELLVVISVIAILMGILLPAVNSVRKHAKITQAKSEMSAIKTAIKNFEAQYGFYPYYNLSSKDDDAICVDNQFDILIENLTYIDGPDVDSDPHYNTITKEYDNPCKSYIPFVTSYNTFQMNPRKVRFIDVKSDYVTNGYRDPWGKPYVVYIDSNYDGKVEVGSDTLHGDVFIYSSGQNMLNEGGIGDDVVAWK